MSATTDLATTFRNQLPYLPRALRLVWNAAPRWTAAWLFLLVGQGLLPVALVYLTLQEPGPRGRRFEGSSYQAV